MQQSVHEQEMDINRMVKLPIIDPVNPSKKYTEKEEKWLREVKAYEFSNLEEPGLMHTFAYGCAGNKMKFQLFHGGTYRVPRFIARHIESRATPMWNWRPDGLGSMRKELSGKKSRFQMREVYE